MSPCDDPGAEDLGGGLVEVGGVVYEVSADACVPKLEEPATTDAEAASDPDVAQSAETPDPEPVQPAAPVMAVDPATVSEGLNTFTLAGSGFDPSLAIFTLVCPLDTALSVDEQAAAVDSLDASDCDFDTLQVVAVDSDGSFIETRDAVVAADFIWVASDPDRIQAAGAAVLVESADPEPPTTTAHEHPHELEPTTTTEPSAATTTTEPSATTTTTPPTTTTAPPESEHHPDFSQYVPGDVVNVAELWPDEGYPADYVCEFLENGEFVDDDGNSNCWRTSEVEPAVARVAEPMQRCASDTGWYGATRVSVYAGTTADGFYEAVVEGGEDSCERIKAWWDQITQAEARRIAEGQYPCEHGAAYNYWRDRHINGLALLAGCWPRLLDGVAEQFRLDDPTEEAARLRHLEGSHIFPPNHPAIVEALYSCYRDALEGPPVGWTPPTAAGEWVTIPLCHALFDNFGSPVRYLGVTPECAAGQFLGKVEERKTRGFIGADYGGVSRYAGSFSWSNCETHASRLLPETMRTSPFAVRCEAVIDFSAETYSARTDAAAQKYGLTRADYIDQTKAMYCEGSRDHLRNYPQFHGDWVASWLPLDGTICFEAALLAAARTAAYGKWTQVKFC